MSRDMGERLDRMFSMGDFTAPPPSGVKCDCDDDDGHFHVRCMEAICDKCNSTELREDFFVYTRDEGYHALAVHARQNDWVVDEERNYYLCPYCK